MKRISNKVRVTLRKLRDLAFYIETRIRYAYHIKRIKREVKVRQINILFLVNEISKWKGQYLFDLLQEDIHFNPIIGLTCADIDWSLSTAERVEKRQKLREYFGERSIQFVEVCDAESLQVSNLRDFNVDIVFYQQPWKLHSKQRPYFLSKYHLTCYFPYYVPNYCSTSIDYCDGFHNFLWRYYVLNDSWRNIISQQIPQFINAVKLKATGHPFLDLISKCDHKKPIKRKVIYAPHWSVYSEYFDNKEKYSTFQHNGKLILEFAKNNPQIEWYFKPHPSLKASLLRTKLWTKKEIDEYYKEWAEIGTVSNGEYINLFSNSDILITDCGSFLVEYPCTNNPVIRLVSSQCGFSIPEPSKKLFDAFYNVNNLEEMDYIFDQIIVKGNDPKRTERLKAVKEAGLLDISASKNIIDDLYAALSII